MSTPIATPRARALGFALRAARDDRRMGLRELARLAHLSAGHLHNWETGFRVPKETEVGVLAGCLRISVEERERLMALARNAREPNWLESVVPGAPAPAATYAECERTATKLFNWQPLLIPGLLQTGDYVRACLGSQRGVTNDDVEVAVLIRMARRDVLSKVEQFTAMIGEEAFRANIGGAAVMIEQLHHVLEIAKRRNVAIRIVPRGAGFHPGLHGCFVVLDYESLPSIVHLEAFRGGAYLYDEADVAAYREVTKQLDELALGEPESIEFIQEVLAELEA
ncbi:MAG TPA: helix-turn-helix transcriptional regulator [Amycolatopsis sp.]|nr:helix-turn-helix transcriptional regulator [Amycolatopsis sp.]